MRRQIQKWIKDLTRDFSKKISKWTISTGKMVNITREIQIKTAMRCHFISTRLARKRKTKTGIGEDVDKLELL